MRKLTAIGSFLAAFLLCIGVTAGLAFAITPEHPMNDLFDNGEDIEKIAPTKGTLIEHIDGVDADDMTDAYAKIRNLASIIGVNMDADIALDDLKTVQEANEVIVDDDPVQSAIGVDNITIPQKTFATNALVIGGTEIPYVASFQTSTAPENTAGLWLGSDDVNDNSWGYFIGHNPGVFTPILDLKVGDTFAIKDFSGAAHTYTVVKEFDVNAGTTWKDIEADVTGYGESAILQTCINGGKQYHIIVAD